MTENATVYLRDLKTGFSGIYHIEWTLDNPPYYLWSEGNYSCDHNRVLFLFGWDSPESEDESAFNCISRRILVEKIVLDTGQVVYSEKEPP